MTAPLTRVEVVGLVADRASTFTDPALRTAEVQTDAFGSPRALSGANALVFSMTESGQRWAVKCFTAAQPDRGFRYDAVADTIAGLAPRWAVAVEHQAVGIEDDGRRLPIVKMRWVEGQDLVVWVRENLGNQARLALLARRFAAVVAEMEEAGVAHGDLQHGNVLVTPDGEVVLVDYDGMYVPPLAAAGACEGGHPAYQSPRRGDGWGPWIDRYSAWVLYASLVALALDPALFHAVPGAGDDRLLLGPDDHEDLAASPVIARLEASPIGDVRAIAGVLRPIGRVDPAELRPLDPARLPDPDGAGWWLERGTPMPPVAGGDAGPVGPAEPTGPDVCDRPTPLSWTSTAGPLRVALVAVMVVGAVLAAVLGWVAAAVAVLADLALGSLAYLRTSEWRIRRVASRDLRTARRQAELARRRAEAALRVVADVEAAALQQHEDRETRRRGRHEAALAAEHAIAEEERVRLAAVWARRTEVQETGSAEVVEVRRRAVAEQSRTVLAQAVLAPQPAYGIDAALVRRLATAGIRTAADVTWAPDVAPGSRVVGDRPGVVLEPGELRAVALWRVRVDPARRGTGVDEVAAQVTQEEALTTALLALAEEEAAVRAEASASRRRAHDLAAEALDDLAVSEQSAREEWRRRIGEARIASRAAQGDLAAADQTARAAHARRRAADPLGLGGWLRHLVGGR